MYIFDMKTRYFFLVLLALLIFGSMYSCKEGDRFGLSIDETNTPEAPEVTGTLSMNGGVRFYYNVPRDKDIIAIKAEYINEAGQTLRFSASYFVDSLDVIGFANIEYYDVKLYAVNRAGQRSQAVIYSVKPNESVISMVVETLKVKPSFGSLFVEWENPLKWTVKIFVSFKFSQNGIKRELVEVFSSNLETYRGIIHDLTEVDNNEIEVDIHIEDTFYNSSEVIPFGKFELLQDTRLPKRHPDDSMKWTLPQPGDSIAGIPAFWGNFGEGRNHKIINDIIDHTDLLDFCHTSNRGRTGSADLPTAERNRWNVLIDLGDYYELSRCLTHQRQQNGAASVRFGGPNIDNNWNVGRYAMWVLNEDVNPPEWEYIREHRIPIPRGLSDLEVIRLANAGDMAFLFPDDPQFSRPTRWFRYEALGGFPNDYAYSDGGQYNLSEITLYGIPARRMPDFAGLLKYVHSDNNNN